jgi:hypothetical protein
MRVIAVLKDGPKRGLEVTLVLQSAVEILTVPQEWIPEPIDLGPLAPGEEVRWVSYWYVNSRKVGGLWRYVHFYRLDSADQDMTGMARTPRSAWELPEGSGQKAPWWLHRR